MRPTRHTVAVVIAVLTLTACGDSRLKKLSTGIEKDSVAVVMGTDTPHRTETYLTNGTYWEILMYARDNAAAADSIAWTKLSPVVIADGKVAGWGWSYWEKEAAELKIALPPKE